VKNSVSFILIVSFLALYVSIPGFAGEVDSLTAELDKLKSQIAADKKANDLAIKAIMKELGKNRSGSTPAKTNTPQIGGYGEIHLNGTEGGKGEYADIHRFVLYLGYDFNDWISFDSETEIEHAYIKDGNGEIAIEQLYVNLDLTDYLNLKFGRILVPVGITNAYHEPPTFHGVERPTLEKNIIPTTWFGEGFGGWGKLTPSLSYELYLLNGLDATGFSASSGIRSGRMKERPGYNNPAITGRLNYAKTAMGPLKEITFGVSGYLAGANNKNKGGDNGLNSEVLLYSSDLRFKFVGFEFKNVFAQIHISDAGNIGNNVPNIISGFYTEVARDVLPMSLRSGKLSDAALYLFARYDVSDNQFEMPTGIAPDPRYSLKEITLGASFLPVRNFSIKADVQIPNDDTDETLDKRFNFGIGWYF
jgi:hypothetical protein